MDDLLFQGGRLVEFIRQQQERLQEEVDKCDADYLLGVSEADLSQYLLSRYSLEAPVILDEQIHQLEPVDTEIRVGSPYRGVTPVRGTVVIVVVPFQGDSRLFSLQPRTFTLNPPKGKVHADRIELTLEMHRADAAKLRQRLNHELESIREYLGWVVIDVEQYNKSLPRVITKAIGRRKTKLLADRKMSESFGLPIVRRDGAPRSYTVPDVRRKPNTVLPALSTEAPLAPEPALDEAEYRHILSIISNMALVMEQSPRAFAEMREEDLRTQFLVQLNGQYEGRATGETFNYQGKTDIIIKDKGRNVFIAECKFWKGPKGLSGTIDQLLSYLSWRDTKTAILLFNKNQNFSRVLLQIPGVVHQHRCYKRSGEPQGDTEFRFMLHQPGDTNREVILTVMAFNVPHLSTREQATPQ